MKSACKISDAVWGLILLTFRNPDAVSYLPFIEEIMKNGNNPVSILALEKVKLASHGNRSVQSLLPMINYIFKKRSIPYQACMATSTLRKVYGRPGRPGSVCLYEVKDVSEVCIPPITKDNGLDNNLANYIHRIFGGHIRSIPIYGDTTEELFYLETEDPMNLLVLKETIKMYYEISKYSVTADKEYEIAKIGLYSFLATSEDLEDDLHIALEVLRPTCVQIVVSKNRKSLPNE